MSAKRHNFNAALFIAFASVSVVANYLIFELRYNWYLSADESRFLSVGYSIFSIAIVYTWILYPSRLATVGLGVLGLIFPSILPGDNFYPLDFKFLIAVVFGVTLLLAATEFRLRFGSERKPD